MAYADACGTEEEESKEEEEEEEAIKAARPLARWMCVSCAHTSCVNPKASRACSSFTK